MYFFKDSKNLRKISAVRWLKKWLGKEGYYALWEKLFKYKFFYYGQKVSASWIFKRINRLGRSRKFLYEVLGYLEGGSKSLIDSIANKIQKNGGEIKLSEGIISIKLNVQGGGKISTNKTQYDFEKIISTIPLPIFTSILKNSAIPTKFIEPYSKINFIACACVILKLRKKVTNKFWININDDRFKIPGIIEFSNLRNLDDHIVYVPFYMPFDNEDYGRSDKAFIDDSWACVRAINPKLKKSDLVSGVCNRYRFAQPICPIDYELKQAPIELMKGIFVADTTSYFPDDRGISESIKFGKDLVQKVII